MLSPHLRHRMSKDMLKDLLVVEHVGLPASLGQLRSRTAGWVTQPDSDRSAKSMLSIEVTCHDP